MKDCRDHLSQSHKIQNNVRRKIYLETFGWQMDAVLYDYCKLSKSHLVRGAGYNETMV